MGGRLSTFIRGSSNGKTVDFESTNVGSTPAPRSNNVIKCVLSLVAGGVFLYVRLNFVSVLAKLSKCLL